MFERTHSSCRGALAAGVLALLTLGVAAPAGAWEPVDAGVHIRGPQARPQVAMPRAAEPAAPPVRHLDDVLAAGGAQARGGRARTVTRQGIDVSHWQGYVRWRMVARSGVDFAIAKATEGTWMVDPWYHRNKRRAQNAGVRFTAYHFANPSRHRNDAVREADYFLRHARLKGTNLLPALDLEKAGGLSDGELRRWVLRWMRRVEHRLGVKPMLYTSPGFWTGNVGDTTRVAKAGFRVLWLSHWETRRPSVPARRWNGHGWTIWQWTESGRVPGVAGWVDRNIYSGPRLRQMTIREMRDERRGGGGGDASHGQESGGERSHRPAPR